MELTSLEIRRLILRILYYQIKKGNNKLKIEDLSIATNIAISQVLSNIKTLEEKGLLITSKSDIHLTEKGIMTIEDREKSYCPNL